jgi:transketolase
MERVEKLAKLIRYWILVSTTTAGSGHPTSSLSATDLMAVLFFSNIFRYDIKNPGFENNDRLIFSKGHASPLFYALWAVAGGISKDELMTLRKFKSRLEGHPTMEFPFTEVPTGSLGQGLSVGVGMALSAKKNALTYKTYVLLGDGEMSEGSNYEALQIAAYYKLENLIGIIDVNRLGQRGETMYGYDLNTYKQRISAFGWETITIDGHDFTQITEAYQKALNAQGRPIMIIAKTIKGKGVSFFEDKEGWHGKVLSQPELEKALKEIGNIDIDLQGSLREPEKDKEQMANGKWLMANSNNNVILGSGATPESRSWTSPDLIGASQDDKKQTSMTYSKNIPVATRRAYGKALVRLIPHNPKIVVLDAEVSNSTYTDMVKKEFPNNFYEMFIAEQNMCGVALGLARSGAIPFVSTFAAFFTRAFDQIRMTGLAKAHVVYCGSHAGVSIGEDGASQMGLEDIAMFRTVWGSTVLYPSDAVSAEKLVELSINLDGLVYIRTTRMETPVLYDQSEEFKVGGSKRHKLKVQNAKFKIVIIAAGITVHEALKAQILLENENVEIVVIDSYSIKPIDSETIIQESKEALAIIVVEDHYAEGGLADAVRSVININIISLAVRKMPKSGKPEELLDYEEISARTIVNKIKTLI